MPSGEHEALLTYIDEVIGATSAGKISWYGINPSTFSWEREAPKARVNLQRVERSLPDKTKEVYHVFQAFDLSGSGFQAVNLSSAGDQQLNEKLAALFDLISARIVERRMTFLKSLLPE